MYKHYLITRFNIIQEWLSKPDRDGKQTQTEEWLDGRFKLFERYTYPSVKAQSTQNFKWLVLFNKDTPLRYKTEFIAKYKNELTIFVPLFLDAYGDENELVLEYINRDNPKEYIVTTRIDSDDIICNNYIAMIQSYFELKHNTFITFRDGLQYICSKEIFRKFDAVANHFVSHVELTNEARTTLCNHGLIAEYGDVIVINTPQMWIEIIHDGNRANPEQSTLPLFVKNVKSRFSVELTQKVNLVFCNLVVKYYIKQNYKHLVDIKNRAKRLVKKIIS